MIPHISKLTPLTIIFLVTIAVTGCSVRFHAAYEPSIVEGLSALDTETSAFLTSLCPRDAAKLAPDTLCTTKDDYAQRKAGYDKILAKAQTVKALVEARPEPKPFLSRWLGAESAADARTAIAAAPKAEVNDEIGRDTVQKALLQAFDAPTDEALGGMEEIIAKLAQKDADIGLKAGRIASARVAWRIEMRNALTFEMALDR